MISSSNGPRLDGFGSIHQTMRKRLLWGGLLMTVLGVIAVAMPVVSSVVVSVFIGWLLALSGIVTIAAAVSFRGTGMFVWQLLAGLLPLIAGLLLLLYPLEGLIALTVIIAAVFLLTGAAQLAFAIWMRPAGGWVWGFLSAVVSLALGVFIFATLPEASGVLLGILVGIDFISTGLALVLIGRAVTPIQ